MQLSNPTALNQQVEDHDTLWARGAETTVQASLLPRWSSGSAHITCPRL